MSALRAFLKAHTQPCMLCTSLRLTSKKQYRPPLF